MALVLIVSLLFVFLGVSKNFSYRISNFYYWAVNGFGFFGKELTVRSSSYKSRSELSKELRDVQLQYNKLIAVNLANKTLLAENQQLRQLLNLKKYSNFSAVTAEVYLENPVFASEYFSINKGQINGIKAGSLAVTVINKDGKYEPVVVGRIHEVAKHTAVVRTILNSQTQLSVKLANNNIIGVITSGYRQDDQFLSIVNYLPKKSIFEKGELVYTSGLSNFTPGGILVGELISNIGASRTLNETTYEQVECRIFAPLEKIKFVVVLNRQ